MYTYSERIGMPHAPKNHQKALKDIIYFINANTSKDLEALPEAPLTPHKKSKIPDIVIDDVNTDETVCTVEVELEANTDISIAKMREYMACMGIKECFLFIYEPVGSRDYEITAIYRVTPDGHDEDNYSTVLGLNFQPFL